MEQKVGKIRFGMPLPIRAIPLPAAPSIVSVAQQAIRELAAAQTVCLMAEKEHMGCDLIQPNNCPICRALKAWRRAKGDT